MQAASRAARDEQGGRALSKHPRSALASLLAIACLATSAPGQAPADPDAPEKVSNDQPSRPLQMPPASSETREAFDDFERFSRRGAWERATKALYAIPEAQANRFVDGPDGFIISVARKRRAVLAGLSPEGVAAYRLFYDADAKKMIDGAEGSTEQATLETLFSSYFLTSVGDNAADRLGDLYFEQGRFDHAADCWLAVLRERPDSEIPPALMAVKAALALAKAGRKAEAEAIRAEVAGRYGDEVVTVAGREAKAAEHLARIAGEPGPPASPDARPDAGPPPALADAPDPAWQFRFADSVTAGMTPLEVSQWATNNLSGAVPAAAVEGSTLFLNYLGHVLAIDLDGGKLLWRSASFHNLEVSAMRGQGMVDPKRFAVVAAPGFVWSLGRDLKEMNYQATSRLVCRRAENGEVVWQSTDLPDYAGFDPMGRPLLARGTLYLAGKSAAGSNGGDNLPKQVVLAVRPHDGKVLWKAEVGNFREGQQYYYYASRDTTPQPRLAYRSGSLYLDTHAGILARLDAETGRLDWGYAYATEAVQGQSRIFFSSSMPTQATPPSAEAPLESGGALLIKGAKADRIAAIDPDRMKLLWDRPIARSARLLGADDRALYLGGPDLGALDRETRALRWSTSVPGGSEDGRLIVRPDGLWQLTPRGIFEVDPGSGRVRRIFRGGDLGASGGDLVLTDRWLLAISNRTITAYPRGGVGPDRAAAASGATETRGTDE